MAVKVNVNNLDISNVYFQNTSPFVQGGLIYMIIMDNTFIEMRDSIFSKIFIITTEKIFSNSAGLIVVNIPSSELLLKNIKVLYIQAISQNGPIILTCR